MNTAEALLLECSDALDGVRSRIKSAMQAQTEHGPTSPEFALAVAAVSTAMEELAGNARSLLLATVVAPAPRGGRSRFASSRPRDHHGRFERIHDAAHGDQP